MKKRRIRKIWALVNPIEHAINGACIESENELDNSLLKDLACIDSFVHGMAGFYEWSYIASINNTVQALVSMGIGVEAKKDCENLEIALIEAADRFKKTKKMGLSGPGIQAVKHIIEWHNLQRRSISKSKYKEAGSLAHRWIKSNYKTIDLANRF